MDALKVIGRTIAVIGSGFNNIYPKDNINLFNKIISNNGAVVTEYLPDIKPLTQNFPARNRIIAGLCIGVLVVEAKEQSGALITAEMAKKQNKEVFAVLGNINSKYSIGTNSLVKYGAKPVTCLEDVLEEYKELNIRQNYNKLDNAVFTIEKNKREINVKNLSREQREVFNLISNIPIHIDDICRELRLNINKLNSILTLLELQGYVKQLPGKMFMKE
jgi:Predicted Rossmann fold nucleotide-binding protein involved in DNA uptake